MGKSCTLVMQENVTFERNLGPVAGRFFQQLLESHGIRVHGPDELERFEGDRRVERVITQGGLELPAQAVVVGAGVMPDTGLAQRAGIEIGERAGLRCSDRLETSAPGVWAAGDICEYDSDLHGGAPLRVEHWDVAFNQGKAAALNMLGKDQPYLEVPYFFSVLADWGELEYVGPAKEWDQETRARLDRMTGAFTMWYLADGVVKAALTFGRPDDLDDARRLLAAGHRARARASAPLSRIGTRIWPASVGRPLSYTALDRRRSLREAGETPARTRHCDRGMPNAARRRACSH